MVSVETQKVVLETPEVSVDPSVKSIAEISDTMVSDAEVQLTEETEVTVEVQDSLLEKSVTVQTESIKEEDFTSVTLDSVDASLAEELRQTYVEKDSKKSFKDLPRSSKVSLKSESVKQPLSKSVVLTKSSRSLRVEPESKSLMVPEKKISIVKRLSVREPVSTAPSVEKSLRSVDHSTKKSCSVKNVINVEKMVETLDQMSVKESQSSLFIKSVLESQKDSSRNTIKFDDFVEDGDQEDFPESIAEFESDEKETFEVIDLVKNISSDDMDKFFDEQMDTINDKLYDSILIFNNLVFVYNQMKKDKIKNFKYIESQMKMYKRVMDLFTI